MFAEFTHRVIECRLQFGNRSSSLEDLKGPFAPTPQPTSTSRTYYLPDPSTAGAMVNKSISHSQVKTQLMSILNQLVYVLSSIQSQSRPVRLLRSNHHNTDDVPAPGPGHAWYCSHATPTLAVVSVPPATCSSAAG